MRKFSIGIDFGTSVVKATALDIDARFYTQVSDVYLDKSEQSTPSGWSKVLQRVIENILSTLSGEFIIESMAITAMIPNVSIVSGDERILGSLLFCDNDAYELERKLDIELKSSKWANEVLSKILFISKDYGGENYRWFTTHNWLVKELTGNFVIDSVTAGECGSLIDFDCGWNEKILEKFDLNKDSFPQIVSPSTIVGTVRSDYPIEKIRDVPIAAGTSDTIATSLGAGWKDISNSLLVYYGTFNCAAIVKNSRTQTLNSNLPINPFDWILSIPRAGHQIDHIASLFVDHGSLSQKRKLLDELASFSTPGANGLTFLHSQNISDTTVSSIPSAAIHYLETRHNRGDIFRAMLEGFAYLLRISLIDRKLAEENFPVVFSAGGGARSHLWRQIVSDISGLTQIYRPSADRGMGSALLAAYSISSTTFAKYDEFFHDQELKTTTIYQSEYENAYARYVNTCNMRPVSQI